MRKIMFLASLTCLLALGSCEKDWVCHCTDQDGNTENFTEEDKTLSQARSACKDREYERDILGVHTSQDCSLQ